LSRAEFSLIGNSSVTAAAERTKWMHNVASDRVSAQLDNSQRVERQRLATAPHGEPSSKTPKTSSARRNCRELSAQRKTERASACNRNELPGEDQSEFFGSSLNPEP
jgi:hypothetical protein